MFPYFLQGLSLGLLAAAQPGPFQAFLLGRALKSGWRGALPAAFAPLLSDGPIIALILLLLTQLPELFLRVVQISGGLFMLYLALAALKSWQTVKFEVGQEGGGSGRDTFLQATLMNLLNPNTYIFWGLIGGPILISSWQQSPAATFAFLAGMYGTLIAGFALLAFLFATARQFGPRVSRALLFVSALALFGLGLFQIWNGITK